MKQYRYIDVEFRADEKENKIQGYFSVFGPEYNMGQGISERIDPHAFDVTLREDTGNIRCLWNHNDDIVLGRTGNGTLILRVDDHGLYGEVTINEEDSDAMNGLARIRRGDVSQCSFGFEIVEQEILERGNDMLFTIKQAKLWEVSPVTFPAYRETSISARKHDAEKARADCLNAWKIATKERLRNGIKAVNGKEES